MASSPSPSIDYEQAQSLMHAVGQIYLHEQLTFNLLADCSVEYKHLAESANRAKEGWQKANRPTIEKSQRIQSLVAESIQAQRSDYDAFKFTVDIESLINTSVAEFRSEMASHSRKHRHYLCNRLILSIMAGEWDLKQKVPDGVAIISKFKD